MSRLNSIALIASASLLAWLWMQAVHELGHVAAAWLTGGTVQRVVLHPLAISRTDVEPNPQPLVVAWSGPMLGALLPLAAWLVAVWRRWRLAWLARYFAGFCLLANGLYLGVGSFQGIGDAGDLQRHGAPIWTLWLFGIATVPAGLLLWNRLGPHFGLGRHAAAVSGRLAVGCGLALAATVLAEVLLAT